jgi:glycerol-3-phosphate acyltransferase PlsY
LTLVGVVVCGYLLGSVPFSFLLTRWWTGVDLRAVGSGNIGATNAGRVLGWPGGALGVLLDGGKGWLAVWGATRLSFGDMWVYPPEWLRALAGISVIAGHLFPIFLKGKGGKGVATSAGVFLALAPASIGIAVAAFALSLGIVRIVSVSSMLAAIALPVAMWSFHVPPLYQWVGRLAALAVIVLHFPNLKRLWQGGEPRLQFKKSV